MEFLKAALKDMLMLSAIYALFLLIYSVEEMKGPFIVGVILFFAIEAVYYFRWYRKKT